MQRAYVPERPDVLLVAHPYVEPREGHGQQGADPEHEGHAARVPFAREPPDAALEARRDGRDAVCERADEQARDGVKEGEDGVESLRTTSEEEGCA